MIDVVRDSPAILLIAVLALAIIAYLIFRPRQRVRLSDSTPVRPHMTKAKDSSREGVGLASEAAVVTDQLLRAPLDAGQGEDVVADDFQRLKGVGPKFAQMLQARGFFRFDQLASLTPAEVARLDPHLGAFRGRILRDRIIEQADYLARGDQDAFEQHFGKL